MANQLVGLNKRMNASLKASGEKLGTVDRVKEYAINAIRDEIVTALKSDWLADKIAETINELAAAAGIAFNLTNIRDEEQTKLDVDQAVTAKINTLAGTSFTSLKTVNREEICNEVGRLVGERLGVGNLFPVAAFRETMGAQLVSAFDGVGVGGHALFDAGVVQLVEQKLVSGWRELSVKAVDNGNPMNKAGPPRDAAHAAVRAAGRKRQAEYRKRHYLQWVPLGSANVSTENGREGLTGKAAGNAKPVRDPNYYNYRRDQ